MNALADSVATILCSRRASLAGLVLSLFIFAACGAKAKLQVTTKDNPTTLTDDPAEKVEDKIEEILNPISFTLLKAEYEEGKIHIAWDGSKNEIEQYRLVIARDKDCKYAIFELEALKSSEYTLSVHQPGEYFVCLMGQSQGKERIAINSGTKVLVPDETDKAAYLASKYLILEVEDVLAGSEFAVDVEVRNAFHKRVSDYQKDVTLICTGSVVGCGVVAISDGRGSLTLSGTLAQTIQLSLQDSDNTDLSVSSTQRFLILPAAAAKFVIIEPLQQARRRIFRSKFMMPTAIASQAIRTMSAYKPTAPQAAKGWWRSSTA